MRITSDMAESVSQHFESTSIQVAFCKFCLKRFFISLSGWRIISGRCSCSWSCCDEARPGNKSHQVHIEYRAATYEDILDAEYTDLIKDFREYL